MVKVLLCAAAEDRGAAGKKYREVGTWQLRATAYVTLRAVVIREVARAAGRENR